MFNHTDSVDASNWRKSYA